MIDWPFDWLLDWIMNWLIDWLIDELTNKWLKWWIRKRKNNVWWTCCRETVTGNEMFHTGPFSIEFFSCSLEFVKVKFRVSAHYKKKEINFIHSTSLVTNQEITWSQRVQLKWSLLRVRFVVNWSYCFIHKIYNEWYMFVVQLWWD